jgi:hypothetical protein
MKSKIKGKSDSGSGKILLDSRWIRRYKNVYHRKTEHNECGGHYWGIDKNGSKRANDNKCRRVAATIC